MTMEYKCLQGGSLEALIEELNKLQTEEDWQVHTCLMSTRGWVQLLLVRTERRVWTDSDGRIIGTAADGNCTFNPSTNTWSHIGSHS